MGMFESRAWLRIIQITCESDLVEARKELMELEDSRRNLEIQIKLRNELVESIKLKLDEVKEKLNDNVKKRIPEESQNTDSGGI